MRATRTNWFERSRRWLALICLLVTLGAPQTAWAKKEPKGPPVPEEKSYVTQYSLVLMCIALGMVLICKPSGRAERVKMPDE
ncbi:MAG: hypothetical protein KF708_01310 [Pirellulales bacterium]|nr:hypothetical protein [Pirellulales bacterium]